MIHTDLWCRAVWRNRLWQLAGHFLVLVTLACALVPQAAQAQRKRGYPETPSERAQALVDLRSGFQRLSAGDALGAIALLNRAIDSEYLPDGPLGSAHFFRGAALREQGKFREALEDLDVAAKLTPDKPQVPVLAFDIAIRMGKLSLAQTHALKVATAFPADAGSLDLASIFRVVQYLDRGRTRDEALALRLALFDAGYKGNPRGVEADGLYQPLVASFLDRNDIANAVRVTTALGSVDVLLPMLVDRRFEPVWKTIEGADGSGLQTVLAKQAEVYRDILKDAPDDVDAMHHLVDALRMLGRPADAVAASARMLSDPVALGNDPDAYFWVLSQSAYADAEAGAPARGAQKTTEIMPYKLSEYPELVSHHINRGAYLLEQGDFAAASKAARLAESKYLSPYGRLWIASIDACAATGNKQKPETVQPFLDTLKDGARTNPAAYAMALLCTNKLVEAEQFYIRRLGDPEMRVDALEALQIYAKAPFEGAHFAALQERLALVRARPAVRKAVDKVGRTLSFTIPRTATGGY